MIKEEARKYALALRKKLSVEEATASALLKIKKNQWLEHANKVAIYYPIQHEINLLELLKAYPQNEFYLPKTNRPLQFIPYHLNDPLVEGPYHIMEPIGTPISLSSLDVIFIPCVAISKDHKRLGYGKGYYDQALKDYKGLKIGVCYEALTGLDISMNDDDLTLDEIV